MDVLNEQRRGKSAKEKEAPPRNTIWKSEFNGVGIIEK